MIFYALSKKVRGLPIITIDGLSGISGISWCLWIIGFALFFLAPSYWLVALLLAACGLFLKVVSKIGLIGVLMNDDIDRK
jgi:Predicted membrane protein